MKILCVIDSLGSGGAQRQLVELAIGFKERGHDVSFLVYHEENFFNKDLEINDIGITIIKEKNYIKRVWKMRKFIRNSRTDVVLSFLEAANFICTISSFPNKKWKLVVGERSANPNILTSPKLRIYRWFHLFADYIVANSNRNLEMIIKINPLLKNNKCKVIYNIVDENKWCNNDLIDHYYPEKFHLIIVASHQYLKNAQGMINAINLLSSNDKKNIKVSWFGNKSLDNSFDDSNELVRKYNLESIISFYPAVSDIKNKMMSADCLGLFSFYEGLPNVVCEAMMLGKPIISSNVSDLSMFLDKDFIFDPNDSVKMSSIISELIRTDRSKLQKVSIKNMEKAKLYFSKTDIVNSYLNLFI